MVRNHEIKCIVLPWPARTDVRERENWIYDLQAQPYTGLMPMDIPQNVNADVDTNNEYDHLDYGSPAHHSPHMHVSPSRTAPGYSNPFAGTSLRFVYTEDMYQDQMAHEAERDSLFYAMFEQQQDMVEFMRESQCQTDRCLRSVMETKPPWQPNRCVCRRP